ncbi:MAG: DUF2493 domain-containing protein [Erysipelotrichaceae bacterium]|nr:DUF2493 domain-containing protein [Erysipelotrichaceae bacterium]
MKKVIIAGTRYFNNYELLRKTCDEILAGKSDIVIVSGRATGADILGERYATEKGNRVIRFLPDWNKYGKAAGPIRNKQMAEASDTLIAFWDGKSRGTKSMIDLARQNRLNVHAIDYTKI